MAVAALFAPSMTAIKTALRLEGAATASALAVIDQAVRDVRIEIYRRLSATRVTAILLTADTDAPTTDAQIVRCLATSVEIKWVRLLLLRRLPTVFIDSSGMKQQAWNDEAGFRAATTNLQKEIERLEAEIDADLEALSGDVDIDDKSAFNVSCLGPDTTPDLPGATVWPSLRLSED